MTTFDEVILSDNTNLSPNFVLEIKEVFYAVRQPDSGIAIESENLVLDKIKLPTSKTDIKQAKTSFPTLDLNFIDKNKTFSENIYLEPNFLLSEVVKIWYGFSNVDMDFSEYHRAPDMVVKGLKHKKNIVTVKTRSYLNLATDSAFNVQGGLKVAMTNVSTTIVVNTTQDVFEGATYVLISSELIQFTTKVYDSGLQQTTLSNLTRGLYGTPVQSHDINVSCKQIEIDEANPIDIILRLLISGGEASSYNTYWDGAGIPESQIDIAQFNVIKNTFFVGETWRLFFVEIDNLIQYIEKEILTPNNLRIVIGSENEKITLTIYRTVAGTIPALDFDKTNIRQNSESWDFDGDNIVNQIVANWDFVQGLGYQRQTTTNFTPSQIIYGIRQKTINMGGIQTDLGGQTGVIQRANAIFEKFQTPTLTIGFVSNRIGALAIVGSAVNVNIEGFLSPASPIAYNRIGELLSKEYDHNTLSTKIKVLDAPFKTEIRVGRFAADPIITNVTDQASFETEYVDGLEVGDKMRLYDTISLAFVEQLVEITQIVGVQITVSPNFVEILVDDRYRFYPPMYSDATIIQKRKMGFFSDENNNFPDGGSPYQFTFD